MSQLFGLNKSSFYKIIDVFTIYKQSINEVILFGSRARGDEKVISDIDIAIKFKDEVATLENISDKINTLDIIYTVDLLDYSKISNSKLKSYINSEGVVIFSTNERGDIQLNLNKVIDKSKDLERAVFKLQEVAKRDPHIDDIVLDATIQRFEFTYELSWKLMKTYLEYNGNTEATSPRSAIRQAFKVELITDGDIWIKMLNDRNRTSHTYDEDTAYEIFDNINKYYLTAFNNFITTMKIQLKNLD